MINDQRGGGEREMKSVSALRDAKTSTTDDDDDDSYAAGGNLSRRAAADPANRNDQAHPTTQRVTLLCMITQSRRIGSPKQMTRDTHV
jgi:hypothetical protein